MTDVDRELDQLVASARAVDQPAPREAHRVWVKLAGGTLATAATVTTTTAAAGAAAGATSLGATGTLFGIALAKWGTGLAVLAMAGGAVVATHDFGREPPAARIVSPAAGQSAPPQRSRPPPAPPRLESEPATSATPPTPAAPPPKKAAPAAPAPDPLTEEVVLLRAAKVAANEGHTARAMAKLDEYDRRFPKGKLRNEAYATRAQAYCGAGNTAAARAAMSRLSPDSPLAQRLELDCGK